MNIISGRKQDMTDAGGGGGYRSSYTYYPDPSTTYAKALYDINTKRTAGTGTKSGGGGGGGGGGSAAVTVNPYQSYLDKAQSKLNAVKKPTYTDSYQSRIDQMTASGSPTYQSRYQQNIDALLNQLQSRKDFSYNLSQDPLYNQYKAQYMAQGRQAMQDTMGQAAALTGGYGSSYASTAGNQAYQGYLGQLNDKAMDLAFLAQQRYDSQGSNLRSNLSALQTQESADRTNYESDRQDYYNQLNQLRSSQGTQYQKYQDLMSNYYDDYQNALAEYQYWRNRYDGK